jgi:adenine deaminase
MIREGSAAKNLEALLPLVTPLNSAQILFCSDDRHPVDILTEGHIDGMVRRAVRSGMNPITAVQIASLNAARYFGLTDRGAIAPGYKADLVVMSSPEDLRALKTIKDGRIVAERGVLTAEAGMNKQLPEMRRALETVYLGPLQESSFQIAAEPGYARVIQVVPNQIVTKTVLLRPLEEMGLIRADLERDVLPMAVVERHRASGNIGLCLVSGLGLKRGAIATSVTHDSHNIAVCGTDAKEMLRAVEAIRDMRGGLVAISNGVIKAALPLPIAGLLSDKPMREVALGIEKVVEAAHELGSNLEDPFMTLSFLCLPVIPELKLTDLGLVDVARFQHVPLFVKEQGKP